MPSLGGGSNRPWVRPGTDRPSRGDVGDFLGIKDGIRPETLPGRIPGGNRPTTLPGRLPGRLPGDSIANRPGTGSRPGAGNRPGNNFPGNNFSGNRRPDIDIGNLNIGNTVINNRPSWVNIDRDRVVGMQNRWGNQIGGLHNYASTRPARVNRWNDYGDHVRFRWNGYHNHNRWFAGDFWYGHPGGLCRWHYYHRFNYHPWRYWWSVPTFAVAANWFTWTSPATVWNEPIYYDYGDGGNVTYENNYVYVNGEQVATADDFAQSAAALATVQPPESDDQAAEAEWLPLGTFAVSTDESDTEPDRVLQIAVDKSGIVAGTLYNRKTDKADAVQGRVDKATQRVAFRFGESDTVIGETGLYNLTQDEAPLLVHFGEERVENYILVRLEAPEGEDGDESEGDDQASTDEP